MTSWTHYTHATHTHMQNIHTCPHAVHLQADGDGVGKGTNSNIMILHCKSFSYSISWINYWNNVRSGNSHLTSSACHTGVDVCHM